MGTGTQRLTNAAFQHPSPSWQAAVSAGAPLPLAFSPAAPGTADVESSCRRLSLPRLKKIYRSIRSAIDFPSLCSLHEFLGESFCWGNVNQLRNKQHREQQTAVLQGTKAIEKGKNPSSPPNLCMYH